jgi:hypothetical protein
MSFQWREDYTPGRNLARGVECSKGLSLEPLGALRALDGSTGPWYWSVAGAGEAQVRAFFRRTQYVVAGLIWTVTN